MSEQNQPRKLNTGSAQHRVYHAGDAAGNGASGASGASGNSRGTSRNIRTSSGSGRTSRSASSGAAAGGGTYHASSRPASSGRRGGKRRKKKGGCLKPFLIMLLALCAIVLIAWQVVMRAIAPDSGGVSLGDLINSIGTPDEYSGDVINILVCGIDSDDGETRSYGDGSNDGMTDMIMYVNFDVKNKQAHMLQIPRNTFVGGSITTPNGTYSASNGQINSVALSNGSNISALADVVNYQLQLPVDYYISINMAALKEVVDTFGGIEVYVPQDIQYNGSVLSQGYQTLDGKAAEFFVRNRHGSGYESGDLARLNMQRYFYSGLLRRIRTMTPKDAVKLTPAFMNYVTTDLDTGTIAKLAISLLKTDSADIMMCQLPEYNCGQRYLDVHSVLVAAPDEDAALLNQYFRSYTGEVAVGDLHLADWPVSGAASDPNIQFMGQLDTETETGQQNENLDGSYTVTAENTATQAK